MSLLDMLGAGSAGKNDVPNADFVAFVSDETNTATMRQYVAQRALPHAEVQCGAIDQAIAHLRLMERMPQQLVVDVSGSDTPLSELSRLAEVCAPSVDVYVLGSKNDVGLYRSLLQIGVRDYMVKPLTVELLTRTLGVGTVGHDEPVQRSRTGKVITLMGARGGLGVSSVCAHLAQYLAEEKQRRVALVDLDVYSGAISVLLGESTNQGLVDVLQNVQRLDPQYMDRTMIKHGSRLYILTAELGFADSLNVESGALAQLIEILKRHFHYVLIDAPRHGAGIAMLTEEALDQSQLVYLLADQTVHSACVVTRLAQHIFIRQNEPVVSVLLNHVAPQAPAHISREDFAKSTQRAVHFELPYDPAALTLAQNLGERLKAISPFAKAVARIGDDLSGTATAEKKSPGKPSGSLLRDLAQRIQKVLH
jgi:pilus assembly protein CpaE